MDCCGHEGHGSGDARFEIKKVADGVHVAVAAPAYKVNSNTAIIESDGGVIIVDTHSKPSAAYPDAPPGPRRDRRAQSRARRSPDAGATRQARGRLAPGRVVPGRSPGAQALDRLAQLDFTHLIMGHGDVAGRDWLSTFRSYIHDMVEAVRQEAAAGATLEEVKQRVPAKLAPTYEKPFSAYGDYRPWREGIVRNIERTYAMVS